MPWKETCRMDQRLQFVLERRSGTMSMAALCRAFGISRQTGYKWIKRFSPRLGAASLQELSRRPHASPAATPPDIVRKILSRRHQFPHWGPRKLLELLKLQWRDVRWPSASTVGEILKRRGLVAPRPHRNRLHPRTRPFAQCRAPNDVWCVDFKGHFRTGDRVTCYPLTVMDAASRFLLACVALPAPEGQSVRRAFVQLFRQHGLPKAIRCDNGEPFTAARAPAGISQLSAWWLKLGIRVERIDPGKPQQNGRHERMHLTLKIETASPPRGSLTLQQKAFDRFRDRYNFVRPHQALGFKPPAAFYRRSQRELPSPTPRFDYPFADRYLVAADGCIRWGHARFFISSSLAGEIVGIHYLDKRYAEVAFGPISLGLIDCAQLHRGLLRPRVDGRKQRFRLSTMSPV